MKKEYKKLNSLIKKSQDILILTHKGPDFDAFASGLILKKFLDTHYPKKEVTFKSRQSPTQNIPLMHEIKIVEKMEIGQEDLVILVDAAGWEICITEEDTIQLTKAKVAVIDHHDTLAKNVEVNVNFNMSSATEQVLDFCKSVMGKKFKITKEIAALGQVGIIFDTGRFLFENAKPHTYELMAELRRVYELDVEDFEYRSSKFPIETLAAISMYIKNIHIQGDMAFTFLTKSQIEGGPLSKTAVNNAQQFVRNNIIRHIQGIHWGFVIKPSYIQENEWYVSFRSTKGYQQVDKITEALNGGGHQYSSACKVKANDADEASKIVLSTITKVLNTTPSSLSQAPEPST